MCTFIICENKNNLANNNAVYRVMVSLQKDMV